MDKAKNIIEISLIDLKKPNKILKLLICVALPISVIQIILFGWKIMATKTDIAISCAYIYILEFSIKLISLYCVSRADSPMDLVLFTILGFNPTTHPFLRLVYVVLKCTLIYLQTEKENNYTYWVKTV